MEKEIKQMTAVHLRDLFKLLDKFGIKIEFEQGRLHCKFCGIVVETGNIYSVLPESGNFSLICDKSECVSLFYEYLDQKNKKEMQK